jgi:hypothetical protein
LLSPTKGEGLLVVASRPTIIEVPLSLSLGKADGPLKLIFDWIKGHTLSAKREMR